MIFGLVKEFMRDVRMNDALLLPFLSSCLAASLPGADVILSYLISYLIVYLLSCCLVALSSCGNNLKEYYIQGIVQAKGSLEHIFVTKD